MRRHLTGIVAFAVLAILASACNTDDSVRTTTSMSDPPLTTTTEPPATTTTEPDPCRGAPFCVIYDIRPEAVWSDGEPVTVADFAHTAELLADPESGAIDRSGYGSIEDVVTIDHKTALVLFDDIYPAWRTLFDVLVPAHYEGPLDVPGAPVSGPFALEEWLPGESITLGRNDAYWSSIDPVSGAPAGTVEELVFIFPDSVRDQLRLLADDEAHLTHPSPLDWMIDELQAMEGVSFDVAPGLFWDHIDFNHDDLLLSQRWVREAISLAIDREAILEETVRGVDPLAGGLDNSIWMQNTPHYEDHYDHMHDPEAAEQILMDHLCQRDTENIYNCWGEPLSFTWATTAGDEYREQVFELVRDDLEQVGIELVLDLRTPSDLFSSSVFFGGPEIWQIINFSWKGEPDPHLGNSTFYCEGEAPSGYGALNVNRYCNDEVASLVRQTENTLDFAERAAAYNEADRIYLEDLAIIPLFQRPLLLAWRSEIAGPEPNASDASHLWNVAAWTGRSRVVVALDNEPAALSPLRPESDEAGMILSTMYQGAHSIDPSLSFQPVLIESATPLRGRG